LQSDAEGGDESSTKITEYGKIKIKNELQRLYPHYISVAKLLDNLDLNYMNIDAVVNKINKNKNK
jgi:hypothetical protein